MQREKMAYKAEVAKRHERSRERKKIEKNYQGRVTERRKGEECHSVLGKMTRCAKCKVTGHI